MFVVEILINGKWQVHDSSDSERMMEMIAAGVAKAWKAFNVQVRVRNTETNEIKEI